MCRIICSMVLVLALSGAARAADTPIPDDAPWYVKEVAIVVGMVEAVGSAATSAWDRAGNLLNGSPPYDYLPSRISEDDRQFFATLGALGLQLSEIRVGGGTFSRTTYRFVASREPSDVDIQHAERKLEQYRSSHGGLRAAAKQHITQSILDVEADRDFILSAAVIELWPWPSVQYEISARNRPPEVADRRMFDAAQQ